MNENIQRLISTAPEGDKEKFTRTMDSFLQMFNRWQDEQSRGKRATVDWAQIRPLRRDDLMDYDQDLTKVDGTNTEHVKDLLSQLVVVKLNGGLGTTMGCTGPKSVIEVRQNLTFLDITVQQIRHLNDRYGVDVPLVLMNSFNTEDDTRKIISKYKDVITILTFNQKQYPRIVKDGLQLMPTCADPSKLDRDEWFPPGHGDVYDSLLRSDLYDRFIREGRRYMFLSNIDNLGATVDLTILQHLVKQDVDFCMEVTPKTRSDVKGGTLIRYATSEGKDDSKIKLLEIASVPEDHVEEFKSIKKFKVFNTNNLWIKLPAIAEKIDKLNNEMDIIVNGKVANDGRSVIQLETAAGAAIQVFDKSIGITVDRSRFLAVKATNDLLLLQSNLYYIDAEGKTSLNPKRIEMTGDTVLPLAKLGSKYKHVSTYNERIGHSVPDLLELEHLTICGDVRFGSNCSLKGHVIIVAPEGTSISIPNDTTLENKVVCPGKDGKGIAIHDHM